MSDTMQLLIGALIAATISWFMTVYCVNRETRKDNARLRGLVDDQIGELMQTRHRLALAEHFLAQLGWTHNGTTYVPMVKETDDAESNVDG